MSRARVCVCVCARARSISHPFCCVTLLYRSACPTVLGTQCLLGGETPWLLGASPGPLAALPGQVTYPGVLVCKPELTLMLTRLIFPANEKTGKAAQMSGSAVRDHLQESVP